MLDVAGLVKNEGFEQLDDDLTWLDGEELSLKRGLVALD